MKDSKEEKDRVFCTEDRGIRNAVIFLFSLILLVLLITGVLLFANARLVPIDVSDCQTPPETLRWEIEKLEGEGTVLAQGWAYDPEQDAVTVKTTALLRDPQTGIFYRIPTAARPLNSSSETDEEQELEEEATETAGFFARGVPFRSGDARELYLLVEDGTHRYLIATDRSF